MFEDDDPNAPDTDPDRDFEQFMGAVTLLTLAILGAIAWMYLALTRGVYGPPL